MSRGRKRRHSSAIPRHINQNALPRGLYFDARKGGCWYVLERDAEGVRRRANVAKRDARLSELHAIVEARHGVIAGSVSTVIAAFHESTQFAELKPATRTQYAAQRRLAETWATKSGPLGSLVIARLSPPFFQRMVDKISAGGHPTKANHLLRYLRRVFAWGIARGHCKTNPCTGVEQAKERKRAKVPTVEIMEAIIAFARLRGSLVARTNGSLSPYLWIVAELAYLLRLRGAEVLDLTDASETPQGVNVSRRKGSRGNLTLWAPRLRAAWDAAVAYRSATTPTSRPCPIDPAQRPLIVAEGGACLQKSSLDTAWQRMMKAAVGAGVITQEQRFGLHGLKHRGVTDTEGTRAEKQDASGHKSASMMDVYDHSVPVVQPTKKD